MASAVGAKLTNMWQCYNVAPGIAIKSEDNKAGLISNPGIYVSTDGKRHVNEARNNRPGGRPTENTMGEIWKQPGGFIWAIWDAAGIEKAGSFLSEGLKDEIASGDIIEADSLEALAAVMERAFAGADTLTVTRQNGHITATADCTFFHYEVTLAEDTCYPTGISVPELNIEIAITDYTPAAGV